MSINIEWKLLNNLKLILRDSEVFIQVLNSIKWRKRTKFRLNTFHLFTLSTSLRCMCLMDWSRAGLKGCQRQVRAWMMSSLLQASLDMDLVHVGESSLNYVEINSSKRKLNHVGIVNMQLQATCLNDWQFAWSFGSSIFSMLKHKTWSFWDVFSEMFKRSRLNWTDAGRRDYVVSWLQYSWTEQSEQTLWNQFLVQSFAWLPSLIVAGVLGKQNFKKRILWNNFTKGRWVSTGVLVS